MERPVLDDDHGDDRQHTGTSTGIDSDMPSDLSAEGSDGSARSLTDDLLDFIDDGKNYAQAEIAFQKTRLSYTADRGKGAAAFGLGAILLIHLALIGLVVGSVIALSPLLSAWGATAVVVAILLIGALLMGLAARKRAGAIASAFRDDRP